MALKAVAVVLGATIKKGFIPGPLNIRELLWNFGGCFAVTCGRKRDFIV
jgi:hypothetical protein